MGQTTNHPDVNFVVWSESTRVKKVKEQRVTRGFKTTHKLYDEQFKYDEVLPRRVYRGLMGFTIKEYVLLDWVYGHHEQQDKQHPLKLSDWAIVKLFKD